MLAATPRLTGLTARSPAPSTGRASPATGLAARAVRPSIIARAASENDATAVSGEWPVTWSLASYEDVGAFFQANVFQVRDGGREWRARARAGHRKKKKKKKTPARPRRPHGPPITAHPQDTAAPDTLLSNIMSTNLVLATPEMKLSDARHLFDEVSSSRWQGV